MSAWTPEELRELAGAPATEIWIGTVRAALRHAADLIEAAHAVRDENERLRAERDAMAKAFLELHATVVGECPSLLNEDSGGSSVLIALVMDALAQIEKERSDG